MRKLLNINSAWKFIRQDEPNAMEKTYNDENWEAVNVPHTWNAIDGANGFDFYKGACWYRKEFTIDTVAQGNKVFIEFNGSNSITDVYVNGQHMGQHRGGYSIFRFDITDVVEFGAAKNTLAVKVDNTVVDDVYPQVADFTFYGGIYRDVNLVIANPVHFDLMDYGSKGIYVIQEEVSEEKASLTIKSKLVNDHEEEKKVRLWIDLVDAEGKNVAYAAKEVVLAAGETQVVEMPVVIENPTLWNGRKNAYMYEANVSLESFNEVVDELSIPFGVRYFEVDAEKGFFLNGEHLALNGVSRHQDRKDMGWAITKKEHKEDMELIKEVGATSIRLAHYQHDQYFYELCDQEGMVIWAEIPFISVMSKTEFDACCGPSLAATGVSISVLESAALICNSTRRSNSRSVWPIERRCRLVSVSHQTSRGRRPAGPPSACSRTGDTGWACPRPCGRSRSRRRAAQVAQPLQADSRHRNSGRPARLGLRRIDLVGQLTEQRRQIARRPEADREGLRQRLAATPRSAPSGGLASDELDRRLGRWIDVAARLTQARTWQAETPSRRAGRASAGSSPTACAKTAAVGSLMATASPSQACQACAASGRRRARHRAAAGSCVRSAGAFPSKTIGVRTILALPARCVSLRSSSSRLLVVEPDDLEEVVAFEQAVAAL